MGSQAFTELAPEVIILDAGEGFLGHGTVIKVLDICPEARVVALDLAHTAINEYRMKRVQRADLDSLMELLWGEASAA